MAQRRRAPASHHDKRESENSLLAHRVVTVTGGTNRGGTRLRTSRPTFKLVGVSVTSSGEASITELMSTRKAANKDLCELLESGVEDN